MRLEALALCLVALAACSSPALAAEPAPAAAHWAQTGWGGGGFYWACAFHPARPGVIYVGGDSAGAYKTDDAGRHWRIINNGLADYAVYSLAVDRKAPDTVYAGTESGLFKSTDAGEHWEFLKATAKDALHITAERGKSVRAVTVDPTDSAVVYAGTPAGKIFKSQDGGQSWKCLHELPDKASVMCIAVAQADPKLILAATTTAGILRSEDAGATWTPLDTPKAATSAAVAPSDPAILYASFGAGGVRKSVDRGKTWAAVGPGIDAKCSVTEVAVDPKDPATVYAIGEFNWDGFFYRSTDGGQTWAANRRMKRDLAANPTLPEEGGKDAETPAISRPRNLAINPLSPKELFVAGNWRLCFSPDGGQTWEERDRGADITCVSDIRFSGPRTFVTSMDEGLMVSDDQGAAWRQLTPRKHSNDVSGHQWRVLIWPKGDTERILTTCSPWADPPNRVLISEDGGRSFRQSLAGLPNYRPKPNTMWGEGYAHALAADPKDPNVIYLGIDGDPEPAAGRTGGGVFKSLDGGATWKQLPNQPGSRRMFYGLAVDPTDSNRVFWGACGTGGLWRSDDAGNSWKHVFKNEWWVFNIALSPAGVVYCPGANLWRSDDHGDTWKKITPFDYAVSIVGLEIHPRDEKTLWISRVSWGSKADGGVYKTTDGGATWQDITGDLPYRKPLVLRFNPATNELWAGGVGLYKLKM